MTVVTTFPATPEAAYAALCDTTTVVSITGRRAANTVALGLVTTSSGGAATTEAVVSTYHSKDAKKFVTSLRCETVENHGTYSVRSHALFEDSVVLRRVSVARYSVKGLEAAHDVALIALDQLVTDGHPNVTRLLTLKTVEV